MAPRKTIASNSGNSEQKAEVTSQKRIRTAVQVRSNGATTVTTASRKRAATVKEKVEAKKVKKEAEEDDSEPESPLSGPEDYTDDELAAEVGEEEHKCEAEDLSEEEESSGEESEDETSKKHKGKRKGKAGKEKTTRKKRKTAEEMAALARPLRARTPNMKILLGAHVSASGGVHMAVANSTKIGGNAFALFLKSQRKWVSKDLTSDAAEEFRKAAKEANYDTMKHAMPHGSYLVNLAQNEKDKQEQAFTCFLDDLKRCEALGIGLYNFHPGSTLGLPRHEALQRIAKRLDEAHKETKFVKTVLENMAGQGNVIGSKLEDLRDIISMVKDKSRVGVCIDTCHTFAAGYDLRTQETFDAFWQKFDEVVGMKYLCGMHINDSKAPLGSHRDLHENIGLGFLGLNAFRLVVNKKELQGIPLVLETPMKTEKDWADEIEILEGLIGVKEDDPKFLAKAEELSKKGAASRDKHWAAYEKKLDEEKKKAEREAKKKEKKEGKGSKGSAKAKKVSSYFTKKTEKVEIEEDSS